MCGIVASFSPEGRVSGDQLERSVQQLEHRGPDAQRVWVSPNGMVGLGHARLSIIDLDGGQQPIANEDERFRIVANGEFYDFEAIQDQLKADGHTLATGSDSEVALHLYEDLGPQCLHQLRGEFAFAIWDSKKRELFAARDRFGVKPLFYAEHQGTLYVASEIKALFAAGVPANWDVTTSLYGLGFARPDRSFFRGVHVLPPGHFLLADEHGIRTQSYWDNVYPEAKDFPPIEDEKSAIDGFREVLDNAVQTRLRADVPVASYLSGGIDSCAVLGLAQQHRSEPIHAFTLSFDHEAYDETALAQEMAGHCGAQSTVIPITQNELADNLRDGIVQAETFCINAHGVAKYLLSRAVRDAGYKVVLTGEGSDELLAGYPHWREDMLRYQRSGQNSEDLEAALAELRASNQVSSSLLLSDDGASLDLSPILARTLGFVPSWMIPQLTLTEKLAGFIRAEALGDAAGADAPSYLLSGLDVEGRIKGRDPVHQSMYLWQKSALPGYILTVLGDRMEMAHSLEGRVPFLDHHVAEYLSRIPVHLKIRGLTEKYILREATKDVLTDAVYRRQKHPFLSPPALFDPNGRLFALAQDTLRSSAVDAVPWLNAQAVRGLMDHVPHLDDEQKNGADILVMWLLSAVFLNEGLVASA